MTTDPTEVWRRERVEQSRAVTAGRQQSNQRARAAALLASMNRRPADLPVREDDADAASLRRGMLT